MSSIHDKFDATLRMAGKRRAFSRGIGVVYRLRAEAEDSKVKFDSDVVIVDPEGSAAPSQPEAWRSLLLHYAHFFSYQAKFAVAEALVQLAERSDRDLEQAVRARERIFADPGDERPGGDAWGRTTLRVGGVAFVGTVWDRLPTIHRGRLWREHGTGVFWGIALPVARALATAALDDIEGMPVNRWAGEIGEYVYSYADDATVWIGARDVRLLIDHP